MQDRTAPVNIVITKDRALYAVALLHGAAAIAFCVALLTFPDAASRHLRLAIMGWSWSLVCVTFPFASYSHFTRRDFFGIGVVLYTLVFFPGALFGARVASYSISNFFAQAVVISLVLSVISIARSIMYREPGKVVVLGCGRIHRDDAQIV